MLPGEGDARTLGALTALRGFGDVAEPPRRVRVWHSLERNNPLGLRLVVAAQPDVVVARGRQPAGCGGRICEALALRGRFRVGALVPLARGVTARIVGLGSLRPGLVTDPAAFGSGALLVRALPAAIAPLMQNIGSSIETSAELRPHAVHGFAVGALAGGCAWRSSASSAATSSCG